MPVEHIYYRFMTPKWLEKNAHFNCSFTCDETQLRIAADERKFERILKVDLVPSGVLGDYDDITVKYKVGLEYSGPPTVRDPQSYVVSDGKYGVGIQIRDPGDYRQIGPYQGVEGDVGRSLDATTFRGGVALASSTSTNLWPNEFEITIKPTEGLGCCYSSIDGGHKLMAAPYRKSPSLSNGVFLEVFRDERAEVYVINYIEVSIFKDTDKSSFVKPRDAPQNN